MKNISRKIYMSIFLLVLFFVPLVTLLKPKSSTSIYEQRTLASIPQITRQGVWDGSYFSGLETAISDHIALRNTMLKTYTALNMFIERPVINDLVIGEEQLLDFYGYSYWDLDYLNEQASVAGDTYEKLYQTITSYGGYFLYVGVPLQSTYFSTRYPQYMDSRSWHTEAIRKVFSSAMIERNVPFLNMAERYMEVGMPDEYYFNTDHHYTYAGAYFTYQAILDKVNTETGWDIPVMETEDLIWHSLENPFLGSSNRKLYALYSTDDVIEFAYPKKEIEFSRIDNGVSVTPQIYQMPEDTTSTVNYNFYMGGDIGETILRTDRDSLKKALIVGDSFTNPLETLLWMSFDETRSIDYRYYTGKNLLEYVEEYKPDIVIMVRDESVYLSQEGNGAVF